MTGMPFSHDEMSRSGTSQIEIVNDFTFENLLELFSVILSYVLLYVSNPPMLADAQQMNTIKRLSINNVVDKQGKQSLYALRILSSNASVRSLVGTR